MNAFFEYIPLILFFIVYKMADLYWATGALIATASLQILYLFFTKQKIPAKTWIIFGLITFFGGLTIFLHDDIFLKWKVTVINMLFAMTLLISHYGFKKNLIKQMLSEGMTLPEPIWTKLNLAWVAFFSLCAILNIYIAFNFSQEVWVNFKVFGLMGMTLVFAFGSIMSIYKYLPQEDANKVSTQSKEEQE